MVTGSHLFLSVCLSLGSGVQHTGFHQSIFTANNVPQLEACDSNKTIEALKRPTELRGAAKFI